MGKVSSRISRKSEHSWLRKKKVLSYTCSKFDIFWSCPVCFDCDRSVSSRKIKGARNGFFSRLPDPKHVLEESVSVRVKERVKISMAGCQENGISRDLSSFFSPLCRLPNEELSLAVRNSPKSWTIRNPISIAIWLVRALGNIVSPETKYSQLGICWSLTSLTDR